MRFAWALALCLASGAAAAEKPAVAVTMDDLPLLGGLGPGDTAEAATARLLAALAAHRAPATGFVVCKRIGDREPVLKQWLAAGFTLANHSTSHRSPDDMGVEAWTADVAACRDRLARITGGPVRRFRYPFVQTGATPERREAARAAVAKLGHEPAPISIDTSDWALADPYVAALTSGNRARADEIGRAYVRHVVTATRHYREVARARTGGDVAYVLLLHATALAADHLGDLLAALEGEGVRFVDLEGALADPVYARPDDYAGPIGMSWLYRFAPAEPKAWAWDDAQQKALSARFDGHAEKAGHIDADLLVRPLREHVWVVTHERPYASNSLVVETGPSTLLLVDTPYTPRATRALLDWAEARFGQRRVVAIETHFHPDRLGGNAALRAAGVETYGSDHTARLLAERGEAVRRQILETVTGNPEQAALFRDLPLLPPEHLFPEADGLALTLDGTPVRVVFPGPGHSPDNLVVHLPTLRVLFGGCLVPRGDRIGNTADADLARWPAALRALRALPADFVVPGHGDRTDPALVDDGLRLLAAPR